MTRQPKVDVSMLFRVAPEQVYDAFTDPAVTTRFWFTDSTGPLTTGAHVEWTWSGVNATVPVDVIAAERPHSLRMRWGNGGDNTDVEWSFDPRPQGTRVRVVESGFHGEPDDIAAHVGDSTGGFAITLAAAKVLLEHGTDAKLVADSMPDEGER